MFEPDSERNGVAFDYAEELLLNPNNIELKIRRQPVGSATGEKHPNTSNELPSKVRVPRLEGNVKAQCSISDAEGRQLAAEQQEYRWLWQHKDN